MKKKQPCKKHFYQTKSFENCPDCGWSMKWEKETKEKYETKNSDRKR